MAKLKKFLEESFKEEFEIKAKIWALSLMAVEENQLLEIVSVNRRQEIVKNVFERMIIQKQIKRVCNKIIPTADNKWVAQQLFGMLEDWIISLINNNNGE